MVLQRADLWKILARKELAKIKVRDSVSSYINTILGQRSLSPVSNYCLPRFTSHEESLDLFTLPDLLILCDNLCESGLAESRLHCNIYTVGSTSRNKAFLKVCLKTGTAKTLTKDNFI